MLRRGPFEMLGRRAAAACGATMVTLSLLAGCGGSAPPGPVTFSADIAPIIFRECAGCHHQTGSAPFSLVDYAEVRRRARQVAEVTRGRSMPPWLPEPGYGEFVGERRLTDPEIALIGRWVDEGAFEGDPAELPPQPRFTEEPQLGEPALDARPPRHLVRLDANHALDIPPGATGFVVTDSVVLPVDVDVLAVYPQARLLARTMEGWAELPDGTERWLLRIDEWDLNWQEVYRYATPIALPAGTRVNMRFSYDNSVNNPRNPNLPPRRVTAGPRVLDEVAHLQLQVRARSASDLRRLMDSR